VRSDQSVFSVPTERGIMTKVDAKGRIVLPKEVRDRLDIEPGAEVEVRADDGRAVVEPERDPGDIVDRMETLIEKGTDERAPPDDDLDAYARDHAETVRRQAERAKRDDE